MMSGSSNNPNHNASHFSIVAGVNLIAVVINLLIGMYLVRQFTPEQYGLITLFLTSFGIFRLLATFGMGNRITIDVARSLSVRQSNSFNRTFYSLLLLRFLIALLLILTSIALHFLANPIYSVVAAILIPASLSDYNLAVLQGGSRPFLIAIGLIAQPISYAVSAFGLYILLRNVYSVYLALIISYFISMLVGFSLARILGLRFPDYNDLDFSYMREAFGFVGITFILVILQYLSTILCVYIVGISARYEQAAQLGVVMNLAYIPAGLLQIPTAAIFQANFVNVLDHEGRTESASYLSWFLLWVFRFSMGAMMTGIFFAKPIVNFLFGHQYLITAPVFALLTPIMVGTVWQSVIIFSLLGLHKPQDTLIPLLIQVIFTGFTCILVIKSMTNSNIIIAGAQVLGVGLGTILLFRKILQFIPITWNLREYGLTIGAAIISMASITFIFFWTPNTVLWNLIKITLSVGFYLLILRRKIWGDSIDSLVANFICNQSREISK